MHATVWTNHQRFTARSPPTRLGFRDDVALDPSPEVVTLRDMILLLAGFGAQTAADTPIRINGHDPLVFGGVVAFGSAGFDKHLLDHGLGGPNGRSRHQA